MELLKRFSKVYTAGDEAIKNDDEVTEILNNKLKDFIKKNKITDYRILNSEISYLPSPAFNTGNEKVICSLYIAYQVLR